MVADQLWLVAGGKVTPFEGDIDDYQARAPARARWRQGRPSATEAPARGNAGARRQKGATQAVRRHARQAGTAKTTLEALEKSIAKLNTARGEIEAKLADPATLQRPAVNVADLQREKVRLERDIAHAEHEWLVAQEAYEAA